MFGQSTSRLAEESLAEAGVVVADDVFNPAWPGVAVGTLRYLDGGGALSVGGAPWLAEPVPATEAT